MHQIAFVSHLLGAAIYFVAATVLAYHKSTRQQIPLLILGCFCTAFWCLAATSYHAQILPYYNVVAITETVQDSVWCLCLIQLIQRTQSVSQQGWFHHLFFRVCAVLFLCALGVNAFFMQTQWRSEEGLLFAQLSYIGNIVISVVALALIEQLYVGTATDKRWRIKFIAIGLGLMFCYDLYMFANALLLKNINPTLWEMRGGVCALVAPLIIWGALRNKTWQQIFMPSRKLIFSSTAFIGCGLYLLAMALVGYALRQFGGNWGKALQILFLSGSVLLLFLLLTSGSVRASFTQFFAKNIFKLRYDYRQEWLRLTQTLAQANQDNIYPLTIKTVADLVESPKGWLLGRNKQGYFQLLDGWNLACPSEQVIFSDQATCDFLLSLNRPTVMSKDDHSPLANLPWAWMIVPLVNETQVNYVVVLAHPRASFSVNWEVQDILLMVGRQLAGSLIQIENASALAVAKQFEAYNQVSAFIAHDLKNIAAQLILIAKNKEKHRDNPKFINSVFQTIDNLNIKLDKLLKQFSSQPKEIAEHVRVRRVLTEAIGLRAHRLPIPKLYWQSSEDELEVAGEVSTLVNVLCHLLENAQQATPKNGHVTVNATQQDNKLIIQIIDTGKGMSSAYIRHELFKPFRSTKGRKGMGIGVYQAKTYIEQHGGQITVQSVVSEGTTFTISFPIIQAVRQNNLKARESDIITKSETLSELES